MRISKIKVNNMHNIAQWGLNMSAQRGRGAKILNIFLKKVFLPICTKLWPKKVGAFPNTLTSFVSSSPFLWENAQEIGWLSPSLKTSRVHKVSWSPGTWLSYKEYCRHCWSPYLHWLLFQPNTKLILTLCLHSRRAESWIICIHMQSSKIGEGKYFHLDAEPKLQVLERSHKVPTLFHILQQILSWVLS